MHDDAPAALPLIAFAIALAIGPQLVHPRRVAVGATAVAVLVAVWRRRPRRCSAGEAPAPHLLVVFLAFFALGAGVATHEATLRRREARAFGSFEPDRFVTISAPIDRDWSARPSSSVLRTSSFRANGHAFNRPLLIYVRSVPPPIANQTTINVSGFLKRNELGIYTLTAKSPILIQYTGELSRASPARWNRALTRRVETFADTFPTEVGLIEAVALGRGERLHDDVRDDFKRGGTYHLLVFSGLQIALAAASMAMLLRWIGAPRVSDVSLLAFAILAPLFVGPTASVARASIAIGLYAVSRLLKRPTSLENLWALSALMRLIVAPEDLTDAAFHLTYAGAGALLFLARRAPRRVRWLVAASSAEIAVTPLTLFHFHQYAIGGSLTTIAMTPLIFLMLIASIAAIAYPCAPFFLTIRGLHRLCIAINGIGAVSSGMFAAPSVVVMSIAFGGAVAAIALARRYRRTLIAIALLLPTIAAVARHLSHRDVAGPELTILDVGQGDAILARDRTHTMLVDGGGRADDDRFGEATLLPMLVDRGIQHIDAVVLSHVHPDHCGGLPAVLRRLDVAELWISPRQFRGPCARELLAAAIERHVPLHLARNGDRRWIGSMTIETRVASRTYRRAAENNSSLVVQLRAGRLTALLTGDIEREAESEIAGGLGRADVLKVAHHGSRSSTTTPFLDVVRPRLAVISCGRNNLFGHPHPSVLTALRARGIPTVRTDLNGNVRIDLAGGHLFVSREIDTFIAGATVNSSYVLDPAPPRSLDPRDRDGSVRDPAELRGIADLGVRSNQHAPERDDRRRHHARGRNRHPRAGKGREESREKSLRGVPHADSTRRDLLPRSPAQRPASGGREDARRVSHEAAPVRAESRKQK
ncbi:MAG: DNA internalization-related competence protein ComEC/Rec2 [Thermoanaerobaculia bacterium]